MRLESNITHVILDEILLNAKNRSSGKQKWITLLISTRVSFIFWAYMILDHFSLKFLNRLFNECIVEKEVSSIESIQTKGRSLKQENVDKLNFISMVGIH